MATPTQSLIKMAKGRQALANVLNSSSRNQIPAAAQGAIKPSTKTLVPSTSSSSSSSTNYSSISSLQPILDGDWNVRATSIRTWMSSNPLKLGIPDDGTLETISAQLNRGGKHAASRNKAWHHILLELSCCGGIEALNFDAAELLSSMNTAFLSQDGPASVFTPAGAEAENIDPRTEEQAQNPASEPSSVGNPSKAIFALRASTKESLSSAMAAEVTQELVATPATEAPVVPPPALEIPALSNQTLEHLKDIPNEPKTKSARVARPTSSQLPATAVPARSIESLSARDGPKNFEEMDKKATEKKVRNIFHHYDLSPSQLLTKNFPPAPNPQENAAPTAAGAKKKLTMMERQELWMAKKKEKVDAKKKAKEEALAESIKPLDVSKSRQSFTMVKAKEKLSTAAKEAIAREKDAASARAAALARSTAAAKEALKEKKAANKGKKKSLKKVVKDVIDKKKADGEFSTAAQAEAQQATPLSPTTAMAKRRNSIAGVEKSSVANEAFPVSDKTVASSSSTPNLKSPVPAEPESETASKYEAGKFFTRIDNSTRRGHLRIRDGSNFQMNSMFRKRDKFSKKGSAVAVLVGTHSEKGDEQVIEVLFDTDKMKEEECFKWWEENESRFSSPKK